MRNETACSQSSIASCHTLEPLVGVPSCFKALIRSLESCNNAGLPEFKSVISLGLNRVQIELAVSANAVNGSRDEVPVVGLPEPERLSPCVVLGLVRPD